jgi:phosphotransferase system  glucose/maltose/N-acetylglucosamine-specific IIC component
VAGNQFGTTYTYIIVGCVIGIVFVLGLAVIITCAIKRCKKKDDGEEKSKPEKKKECKRKDSPPPSRKQSYNRTFVTLKNSYGK